MITIHHFGKIKNQEIYTLSNYYLKLSNKYFKTALISHFDPNRKINTDVIKKISRPGEITILLTENGEGLTTKEFSKKLTKWKNSSVKLNFVIANAWGFDDNVQEQNIKKLSLSNMTFPHEVAHMLLLEQIYRCGNLLSGGKYHK